MNVSEMVGFSKERHVSSNGTTVSWEDSSLNRVINPLVVAILFLTMISIGCSVEILKMKAYFLKPKEPVIAMLAQFGIMPLAAFCISKSLQLEPVKALALLICGCCPGGTLSNVFTLAFKGDISLSIVMTTCSNMAALGTMPLLLFIYCQGVRGLEKAVPYASIVAALALTLVPCAIGLVIRHYKAQHVLILKKVTFSLLAVASIIVLALSMFWIRDKLWLVFTADVVTAATLLPLTGYTLGYVMSKICKLDSKCSRTISMETGCQNTNLCMTILKVVFPEQVIGPMFVFPFVLIIMQTFEALLLILVFRCYKKYNTQTGNNVDVQPEAVKIQQRHQEPGTEKGNQEKMNSAH